MKFTSIVAFLILANPSYSQSFEWVRTVGNTQDSEGNSIAIDDLGNVYTTGIFNGTVDFDPGPGTSSLTSAGSNDIFIQKLDPSGNLVWAKRMGNTGNDVANSIKIDASGNVYSTGFFNGTVDFNPGAAVLNLTSTGANDVYVQKLDVNGNFIWAKRFGSSVYNDYGYSIAVDLMGGVYTVGRYEGTADFDPSAAVYNLTSAGSIDIFVQKMDVNGNFMWASSFGGNSADHAYANTCDDAGNNYTTGYLSSGDCYIKKMDSNGNAIWDRELIGTGLNKGYSISLDDIGNVYTTGNFTGTIDFDPSAGIANSTSMGAEDIFVHKMDASGNFIWAKSMGGSLIDYGFSSAVDANGNVYTTGFFRGVVDFDPGVGVSSFTSEGADDIYIQKLDVNGDFVWVKTMGSVSGDYGNSIAVDASMNIYTTGYFRATVDFDPGAGQVYVNSAGGKNIFVQKLGVCNPNSGIDVVNACDSYNWVDGNTYNSSNNTATFTLTNVSGCDSLVTLNLTINNSTTASESQTACDSYNWALNGTTYTSSGTYTHVGTNAAGCQLTTTLNLTINNSTTASVSQTSCDSYTWPLNGTTYTSSGTYTHVGTNAAGCQLTTTLNLTINTVNSIASAAGNTITVNEAGASYQWVDCNNANSPINGANAQSFTPTSNGSYAVIVTKNGCSETSNCVVINTIGITEIENSSILVYPNPSNGEFVVDFGSLTGQKEVIISDGTGKIVFRINTEESLLSISLNLPKGMYQVMSISENYSIESIKKMIIN